MAGGEELTQVERTRRALRVTFAYAMLCMFASFVAMTDACASRSRLEAIDWSTAACEKRVEACEKRLDVCDARVASKLDSIINLLKQP